MTYPMNPDHALLLWALRHGLWTQQFDPSAPREEDPSRVLRWPSRRHRSPTPPVDIQAAQQASRRTVDHESLSVLVVYESQRGHAHQAADAIADAAASRGAASLTSPIDEIASTRIEAADAVIAGCWTPGKTPFGDEPTRHLASWIEGLPPLEGKPVGVFCTYRFLPHTFADIATRTAETESKIASRFELKGAKVAAKRAIHFKSIHADAAELAGRVLDHVHTA